MRDLLLLSTLAAVALSQVGPNTYPCVLDRPDLGVTYDLTEYAGTQILVSDYRLESSDPWTYAINLCSNGFPPGGPSGPCGKTVNDDGTTDPLSGRPGPAFQYCDSSNCPPGAGNFCKRLGDSAANQQMQLLFQGGGQRDVRGYARGVMFNYTGGNTCHNPQNGLFLPRILSFVFECYNGPSLNPPAALVLEETNCVYFIVVKSRYGCPKQCSRNFGDAPCSNAGTCGYDATNGRARCYCNTNFFGDFCEVLGISTGPPQKSYAGNIVGAFFGGLLVGVVGVLGYNFYTATREGGGWREALQLQRLFAGGGAARAAAPYVYKAAPAAEGGGGGAEPFTSTSGEGAYAPPESDYVAPL